MVGDADEVTYESLRNIWKKEAGSQFSLMKLDPQFYTNVDTRLRELQEDYVREHAVDPNSAKVMILQDEIRNLTRARDDLWDMRAKKIAQFAIVAARGGNPDRGNMARGELELYENLVRVLKDGRRALLKRGERSLAAADAATAKADALARADEDGGRTPAKAPSGPPSPPDPVDADLPKAARAPDAVVEPAKKEAELPGLEKPAPAAAPPAEPPQTVKVTAADEEEDAPGSDADEDTDAAWSSNGLKPRSGRVLVRVLKDVPPFSASDLRTYRLMPEDVVALPPNEARLLASRGLAEALTPAA